MYAKSIAERPPVQPLVQSRRARKYLTLFMFLGSFSALGLLLHERYGMDWLQSAYAVVQDEASAVSKLMLLQHARAPARFADGAVVLLEDQDRCLWDQRMIAEGLALIDAEHWRGRRVLITGHTGFKGGWLALWLTRLGAHVTGVALAPPATPNLFDLARVDGLVDSHLCDIRDAQRLRAIVQSAAPAVVFHLAAQPLVRSSYREPVQTFATNVMGTVHLLDALCGLASVKVAVVDATGKHLSPGIIDCHSHIAVEGSVNEALALARGGAQGPVGQRHVAALGLHQHCRVCRGGYAFEPGRQQPQRRVGGRRSGWPAGFRRHRRDDDRRDPHLVAFARRLCRRGFERRHAPAGIRPRPRERPAAPRTRVAPPIRGTTSAGGSAIVGSVLRGARSHLAHTAASAQRLFGMPFGE